mgnify:CR=1 FL=1
MEQIVKKIVKELGGIGKLPKMLIKYGSIFAIAVFSIAVAILSINKAFIGNYRIIFDCYHAIKVSVSLLAEAIIGGLLIEYLARKR